MWFGFFLIGSAWFVLQDWSTSLWLILTSDSCEEDLLDLQRICVRV